MTTRSAILGRRPLLPGAWRPAAFALAVLCATVTVVLGLLHHDATTPGWVDDVVDPALALGEPTGRRLLWLVVLLGNPVITVVIVAVIVLVAAHVRRWPAIVLAVAGPALAAALTEFVLKPGVGRTLDGTLAFPSGHTTTSAAVASVLLVLLVDARWPRPAQARVLLAALVVVLVVGVATSLIALGLHYTTDTVGGIAVSTTVVLAVALIVDSLEGPNGSPTAAEPKALRPLGHPQETS
jgi:membrane-associated phospholipid phosphatase